MKRSENDELHAFRRWIRALTIEELLKAMEFSFIREEDGRSHEFELFKQMVDLQAPPPTPIHARAHQSASSLGPTDGRDEERRIKRDRFQRPRLFKFVEQTSAGCGPIQRKTNRKQVKQRRFDVIARKFVTASGEVLSLGCTRDQREADEVIMLRTLLCYGVNGGIVRCTLSPQLLEDKQALLQRLHLASRGSFLTVQGHTENIPFCSTWLEPTDQFFSLSKYLVSRFDVALWSSFRGVLRANAELPFQEAASILSHDVIKLAWYKAIVRALSKKILPADVKMHMVRDGLLWRLLRIQANDLSTILLFGNIEKGVGSTYLIDLDTANDELRRIVLPLVQEEISLQIEEELINALQDDEMATAQGTNKTKRIKKKKRKGKRPQEGPVAETEETSNQSGGGDNTYVNLVVNVDEKCVPSVENTRKTLIALSIIEECIENAFREVGLPTGDEEQERAIQKEECISPPIREEMSIKTKLTAEKNVSAEPLYSSDDNLIRGWPIASEYETRMPFQRTHGSVFSFLGDGRATSISFPSHAPRDDVEADLFNASTPGGMTTWSFDSTFDEFDRVKGQQGREKSMFVDLFMKDEEQRMVNEKKVSSSTAASIASSSDKASSDNDSHVDARLEIDVLDPIGGPATQVLTDMAEAESSGIGESIAEAVAQEAPLECLMVEYSEQTGTIVEDVEIPASCLQTNFPSVRSPSPEAPQTPSPRCSPILVSLDDLEKLKERAASLYFTPIGKMPSPTSKTYSTVVSGSLPSSPTPGSTKGPRNLTPSLSRDDLRIAALTEEQWSKKRSRDLPRYADSLLSHRKASITLSNPGSATPQKAASDLGISEIPRLSEVATTHTHLASHDKGKDRECARSETALETHTEDPHWTGAPPIRRKVEVANITTRKDGPAEISTFSRRETDENVLLEERNTFRDLCLTLGAEVAKLKNLLAAQQGGLLYHGMDYTSGPQDVMHNSSYDRAFTPAFFNGISRAQNNIGAMSDAGVNRGDHDSALSEDGTDVVGSRDIGWPRAIHVRRSSSGGTMAGSDTEMDMSVNQPMSHVLPSPNSFRSLNRDAIEAFPVHGMQSRLTKDIVNFLHSTSLQLRNQDSRRQAAIERLSRLVTALWPRAQVKIYGSHVTGLSLPSSDLDFVICLPAVHKNAPAVAPGVLEGRNAINESSQKLLSRKLKGESWIDPRSIKIIDRTVVPVIKVSTKDTRSKMLQLDISFAGPEHHGLEAIEMITAITQELPMVRPLVLVLKQFLFDRSLLTAYTGGLSSYCLFLMVTRYLQEQSTSWGDCGSLLMGFLDFYGNSFDPRATGLSVRRRQYFARTVFARQYQPEQPMWASSLSQHHVPTPPPSLSGSRPDFLRRHSFSDKGNVDANFGGDASRSVQINFAGANGSDASRSVHTMRPPRYQSPYRHSSQYLPPHGQGQHNNAANASARPYTFDPLFVEDPLSMGNNVGRNAFRIFQVQRAFSDAHRALLASLEWDNYSTHDSNEDTGEYYPLLKCLLQTEDVFYDLDDPSHR